MASPRGFAAGLAAAALAASACGGARPRTAHPTRGAGQFVDLLVPEPARSDLGLSGAAVETTEFLDPSETPGLVERLRALAPPSRACVAPPASAWVTFRIWGDGHTAVERVATLAARDATAVRRCLEAAISEWTFPQPPAKRGLVLLQIFPDAPPPGHAVFPLEPDTDAPGLTEPVPVEPGCVSAAMQRSPGAAALAREGAHTVAMFAIDRSGGVSRFHVLEPTPLPVAAAVRGAVEACRWRPSVSEGRTVPVWVIQPFRFSAE